VSIDYFRKSKSTTMNPRLLFTALLIFALSCKPKTPLESLRIDIENRLTKESGTFAVSFRDLQTGDSLLLNEHEVFHAASTMKTPVMIEIYKQADAGTWSLTDSVIIKNEFSSIVDGSSYNLNPLDDSEQELYTKIGQKRTLAELVYDMIIVSSNLATNIVIELADARKVTQTMRELGAPDIQVLRGVEDTKAYEQGMNNTTTAYDQLMIYEKLAKRSIVNEEACDDMIRILLDQKFNEIIPERLPAEVKVAHKTGSITGVQHDAGIVILPDGRQYVLVLLSKNLEDPERGIRAMADVSRMIYDYVNR
jgi:beta-lactamase class A